MTHEGQASSPTVWTLGHSNVTLARLVRLLAALGIEQVEDVRSAPYSRVAPHFGREALERGLRDAGITYTFAGALLGGRPDEPWCYDEEDYVLYDELAALPRFRAGIDRLLATAKVRRTAILCSEEDPSGCHRHLLIGRVLHACGARVMHLRHDGTMQPFESMPDVRNARAAPTLFGDEGHGWRSVRSVSRSARPKTSLRP